MIFFTVLDFLGSQDMLHKSNPVTIYKDRKEGGNHLDSRKITDGLDRIRLKRKYNSPCIGVGVSESLPPHLCHVGGRIDFLSIKQECSTLVLYLENLG